MMWKKYRVIRAVFLCVLSLFFCGCGSLLSPEKIQPLSTYTLGDWKENVAAHRIQKSSSSSSILMTTPNASPGFTSSQMIYLSVPYKMKSFANHRWIAPPAELLLPLMTAALQQQHYFYAILTPPYTGIAEFQLNTRLLTLQQEFLKPQSEVRLVIQATVLKTSNSRVLANRVFSIVVPAPQNDPYSGVLAANQGANQLANQIAEFTIRAVKRS